MEKNDELLLKLPDMKKIPCLTCKYGQTGCTDTFCVKFKRKPSSVYYDNEDCPEYVYYKETKKEQE